LCRSIDAAAPAPAPSRSGFPPAAGPAGRATPFGFAVNGAGASPRMAIRAKQAQPAARGRVLARVLQPRTYMVLAGPRLWSARAIGLALDPQEPVQEVRRGIGVRFDVVGAQAPRSQVGQGGWAASRRHRRALLDCTLGLGHPAGRRFSRAVRGTSKGIAPAARARRPPGRRGPCRPARYRSSGAYARALTSLEVAFGGPPSRSQARGRSRGTALAAVVSPGRWLRRRQARAAAWAGASSSWRFRAAVSGSCSRSWWRPWPA